MADVWQPVKKLPTRREEEQRAAARRAEAAKPKPIPDKPGFFIDGDGKMSYDPSRDPNGKAYKSR